MGCDWVDGIAAFGYHVPFTCFAFKNKKENMFYEENGLMVVGYDAKEHIDKCWKLYCKSFQDRSELKEIECIFCCESIPSSNKHAFKSVDESSFVFGYKLEENMDQSQVAASTQVPTAWFDKVAAFIYLVNETNTFDQSKSKASEIEIPEIPAQAQDKLEKIKKEIEGPGLLVGLY